MKDLEEISCCCYTNAIRLGYKDLSKEATIKHLVGEIEEIKKANPSPENVLIKYISCTESDSSFVDKYEKYIKDTEVCELLDMIFVSLTRLFEIGISINYAVKCKLRYNRLRKVKNDN